MQSIHNVIWLVLLYHRNTIKRHIIVLIVTERLIAINKKFLAYLSLIIISPLPEKRLFYDFVCSLRQSRAFTLYRAPQGRVVESEDFLGFRLHPINCSSSKNQLRLPTFLKPTPTPDSDSSIFENPTPAENMRLHRLPTPTPQPTPKAPHLPPTVS